MPLFVLPLTSAQQTPNWTEQEKPIQAQIIGLRGLPDDVRAQTTKDLALQIRALPASPNKLALANKLASRATEGDFGHDTLQEVATTLADALQQQPPPQKLNPDPYDELAQLVRYEHVQAAVQDPRFEEAMAALESADKRRQDANFTLTDLHGKTWTLKELRGEVVLVNFWATWCPPCQKEMPDLESLYKEFRHQRFVILAISDEDADKVRPFIAERKITYPILLDPGHKVGSLFEVEGIPKSFVYDRDGKLVAQSIDMRTQQQFREMLAQAGLK
ncbi:MAG TPA: TlpA disulfide reductase family protein [Candidatus Bathyarchaeia archaeon]|nr:TlpA disulfide reductase family protein [Candidatus Bathyarchaeia archaeon]